MANVLFHIIILATPAAAAAALALLLLLSSFAQAAAIIVHNPELKNTWMPMKPTTPATTGAASSSSFSWCKGSSAAECLASSGGEYLEMWMDSEINRRLLGATEKYISYGSLQRNAVPCSRRGASYYNCKAGAEANPYTRGCSTITRCRS